MGKRTTRHRASRHGDAISPRAAALLAMGRTVARAPVAPVFGSMAGSDATPMGRGPGPGGEPPKGRRGTVPPFLVVALGALGAMALVKVLTNESRRANARMDRRRAADELKAVPLERDPVTGDYRPRQS